MIKNLLKIGLEDKWALITEKESRKVSLLYAKVPSGCNSDEKEPDQILNQFQ